MIPLQPRKRGRATVAAVVVRTAAAIIGGLHRKQCKCFWTFVSEKHDRYKLHPPCSKPCKVRDEVLARINAG